MMSTHGHLYTLESVLQTMTIDIFRSRDSLQDCAVAATATLKVVVTLTEGKNRGLYRSIRRQLFVALHKPNKAERHCLTGGGIHLHETK